MIIGIDPGKDTGLAVYGRYQAKITHLVTVDFWGVFEFIEKNNISVDLAVIEVPATKANWHGAGAAHNVGRVCREAELMAEGMRRAGYSVIEAHPQGKINSARFKLVTGWTKRTNQHCRDAAMLVYGR